jgi:hypothetical protein
LVICAYFSFRLFFCARCIRPLCGRLARTHVGRPCEASFGILPFSCGWILARIANMLLIFDSKIQKDIDKNSGRNTRKSIASDAI